MNESFNALCQRISIYCLQQCWFAGDIDNPSAIVDPELRYDMHYDRDGKEIIYDRNPDDHPRKTSFAYPPATEEQFLHAEKALGFSFPPLLRVLYTRVANGGFGPGHGLIGAWDGFCEAGDIVDNYLFHQKRCKLVPIKEHIQIDGTLCLSEEIWPLSMIYLCDWGNGTISCLDIQNDKVYVRSPIEYTNNYHFELQSSSLLAWFEQWVAGEMNYEPARLYMLKQLSPSDVKVRFSSSISSLSENDENE